MEEKKFGRTKKYGPFPLSFYLVAFLIVSMIAVAVLAFINPGEMLRKRRDERRKVQINGLAIALSDYYGKDLDNRYPPHTSKRDFIQALLNEQIKVHLIEDIGAVDYIGCSPKDRTVAELDGICYSTDDLTSPSLVVVYSRLESQEAYALCRKYKATQVPYYIWSSLQGVSGIVCASTAPLDPSVDYRFE